MNEKFKVTYKNGKMAYLETLGLPEIVGMMNRMATIVRITEVDHIALGDTLNDLLDSFEHNDRNYSLAIWDNNRKTSILKSFPSTPDSMDALTDKVQSKEYTVLAWISK